jgi:serine/threonine-protein kinase ATR
MWCSFSLSIAILSASSVVLYAETTRHNQQELNTYMSSNSKRILPQVFYTAMPQLISRITHDNRDTASVVRQILRRVLSKFPGQAMWPLAWLRQSKAADRRKAGEVIFHEAEQALQKSDKLAYKMLVASDSLITFLHELAKLEFRDTSKTYFEVKQWKGEVPLSEFVPPVQAALSVVNSPNALSQSKEAFPRRVPRMREFCTRIDLLLSKARPKKIKAYAVVPELGIASQSSPGSKAKSGEKSKNDVGEFHFLVKQEAKGDLRKDARVQDLNNVINRLFGSRLEDKGASTNRRCLRLRTFTVTCLSEDTGILEWVPNTSALRALVSKSYNPQAPAASNKRRGVRAANFGDPHLRTNYEKKCQELYFKNGNLKGAAALFEELCLKPYPPVLYWWFVHHFHDPHTWYESRTRFALSSAAWSAIGHVIGLGDRHSENILIDATSGECVHVDFDW